MPALPPFEPPANTHGPFTSRVISFRHPAYPLSAPNLLVLAATDDRIDYDLALISCCIVTGTPWKDGYLAVNGAAAAVPERVNRPSDGILRGEQYFFYVQGEEPSYKYPVIPSFHHWTFPHDDLPAPWNQLRIPDFVPPIITSKGDAVARLRDLTCRVSGYTDAVELAHIIPAKEKFWFAANNMAKYCRSPIAASPMNDDRNILILRRDIHYLFDNRRFTFLPKVLDTLQLVSHVLLPTGSPEFCGLYHNRSTQPIRGLAVEFLFARFAWSLFTDVHLKFFESELDCKVRVWDKNQGQSHLRTMRGFDVKRITQLFESARSQSGSLSPSKRSHTTYSADEAEDDDIVDYIDAEHQNDDPPRGRTLKRRWDGSRANSSAHLPSLSFGSPGSVERNGPFTPCPRTNRSPSPPAKRVHTEERTTGGNVA